jgi:transposase
MFTWYWLADLCEREGIEFVLGHALYMKAIHGGKSKTDRIDAEKIARLLRGGTFPLSYVYPAEMRSTRDLMRRRMFLMRRRSELLAHVHMTYQQYNLDCPRKRLRYAGNREGLTDPFDDGSVKKMVAVDVAVIDHLDKLINELELFITRHAKVHDGQMFYLLRSVPGIGKVLALVLMYEIHNIRRFASVGDFISYCRLVKCSHSSAGKVCGSGGRKIGNAFLRWAFGEAACLLIRQVPQAKRWIDRKEKKYGKGKALALLSAKLGRGVYWMLRREEVFDVTKFFQS